MRLPVAPLDVYMRNFMKLLPVKNPTCHHEYVIICGRNLPTGKPCKSITGLGARTLYVYNIHIDMDISRRMELLTVPATKDRVAIPVRYELLRSWRCLSRNTCIDFFFFPNAKGSRL